MDQLRGIISISPLARRWMFANTSPLYPTERDQGDRLIPVSLELFWRALMKVVITVVKPRPNRPSKEPW